MEKTLRNLLAEKKPQIQQRWFDAIMETYPKDTSGFLKNQKDQFVNPVGNTIAQSMDKILEVLLEDLEFSALDPFLTDLMKVRAVQDFKPSEAIGFVFELKRIIREEVGKVVDQRNMSQDLIVLDSKIDKLSLASFDIYAQCREILFDIKVKEIKNMTYGLIRQANLVYEIPDDESKAFHEARVQELIQREKRL